MVMVMCHGDASDPSVVGGRVDVIFAVSANLRSFVEAPDRTARELW